MKGEVADASGEERASERSEEGRPREREAEVRVGDCECV